MSTPPDEDIARAQALGRLAARGRKPVSSCPYLGAGGNRVLAMRWVLAYAGAGGRAGVEGLGARARHRVRRAWYGAEEA